MVVVAWGEGIVQMFKGLGSASVVTGGQTMNPSTQELLDAARNTGARDVILLPNNSNIIPAARQAASIVEESSVQPPMDAGGAAWRSDLSESSEIKLHVVPSCTIPQGVAALLAFNPEGTLDGNLESMASALATVKTIEVTRAVRSTTVGGLAVMEGQYIGLLEGDLISVGDSALSVLQETILRGEPVGGQLVTLYWGEDVEEGQAGDAAARLTESVPGLDVEVVYGGQPFYQYIASLE